MDSKTELLATIVTQGELPKPQDQTPAAQPVTAADLTGETTPAAQPAQPAQPVTAGDLIGETATPAAQSSPKPTAASLADVEERIGCQCERCKANPEKRDKRGRHHRICPCDACKRAKGVTVPDFSDMTPEAAATDYSAMSAMIFDSSTGILTMTFGPEWQPQSPQERDAVTKALATYLQAKQVKDIPPGMMLAVVILAYSAQRLKAPTTANKLVMVWTWIKTKLFKRRQPLLTIVSPPANNQTQQTKP